MSKKSLEQFKNVILFSVLGLLVGILLGFIFGTLIAYIVNVVSVSGNEVPPLEIGMFLGMGVGTTVGGIFGGIIGYKK